MAETPKLSVEKALKKLRSADAPPSKSTRLADDMDALGDEIKAPESAETAPGAEQAASD